MRVGDLSIEAFSNTNVRFWGVEGSLSGGTDNLGSKGLQHINLLLGHLFGQSDDHLVSFDSSSQGKTDSCKLGLYNDYRALIMLIFDIPVFPEVGSMRVSPGLMRPEASASSTIRSPILSFTDPPELKNSHLATVEIL